MTPKRRLRDEPLFGDTNSRRGDPVVAVALRVTIILVVLLALGG